MCFFFFFPLGLCSNTFVLEYCGEVLDHKEFKARVKEYARNKNIHYYFMALKNDEVSSGILKERKLCLALCCRALRIYFIFFFNPLLSFNLV